MLQRREKLILRSLAVLLMLYQTVAMFISGQVVTFFIYGALLIMLRQGHNWARLVLGVLLLVSAAVGGLGLTGVIAMNLPYPVATLFILVSYAAAGLWLLCSRGLRQVFRERGEAKRKRTRASGNERSGQSSGNG